MGKAELRIDKALVERARAAGLDPAAVAENALETALGHVSDEQRARQWAEENSEAIKAHRERIEKYGVFGDDLRTW
jgi:antitoxin CcdA